MKFLFYVVLLFANVCIAQQVDIVWAKPVQLTFNNNSVTKLQSPQLASAKSGNILETNIKGWAEFRVSENGVRQGFGFIKSTSTSNEVEGEVDFFNMDYSIQLFNNNTVKIYKNGDLFGQFGTYAAGNILRIERRENQIVFYKNGVRLTTITDASIPSKSFVVNGVIKTNNTSILEAKSSFVKPLSMTSNVVDVHCQSSTNLGSISLSVSGGIQPYTYSWSNGATTSSLSNLKSGTYLIKVSDASGKEISNEFSVLNCVDWTDMTGVSLNGTVITKTLSTEWGNAGAASENVLEGGMDGYVQFSPSTHVKFSALGLTFLNTDHNYTSIDYAFVIDSRRLFIFSSGKFQGDFGKLNNTDVLKIERKGNTILFYKNDIVLYKTETKTEFDLVVDVAFNTKHDYFENVKTSFYVKKSLNVVVKNYENDDQKGSITVNVKGGYPPYEFNFNGANYPTVSELYKEVKAADKDFLIDTIILKNDLDVMKQVNSTYNLFPGERNVTVMDVYREKVSFTGVINTKIVWGLKNGVDITAQVIPPRNLKELTYYYDNGENVMISGSFIEGSNMAVSENSFRNDNDNFVEFSMPDIRDALCLGLFDKDIDKLKEEGVDKGFKDLIDKACIQFTGRGEYYVWFKGAKIYTGKFNSGDVFGMGNDLRTGQFNFYQNGSIVADKHYEEINSQNPTFLKIVLNSQNARIGNLQMRVGPIGLPIPFPTLTFGFVTANVVDIACGASCNGSIDAFGFLSGISVPVKYELVDMQSSAVTTKLYTSGPNHALFTNLCPGKYQVKYYSNKSNMVVIGSGMPLTTQYIITQQFEIGYLPDWINNINCSINASDNSLEKTLGGSTPNIAGASTSNIINQSQSLSDWMEFKVAGFRLLNGISITDPNQKANSIRYGIYVVNLPSSRNYYMKKLNSLTFMTSTNLNPNDDLIRMEKNGTNLIIKINGIVKGTIQGLTNNDYIMDATIQDLNAKIVKPRVSFRCKTISQYAILKKELDASYYTSYNGQFYFTVDGDYSTVPLNYKVYNYNRAVQNGLSINNSVLENGDNRFNINIASLSGGFYVLEVINQKQEKLVLRFKK